jgi:hypothetical protein
MKMKEERDESGKKKGGLNWKGRNKTASLFII